MRKAYYIFAVTILALLVLPHIPLPFRKPRFLHTIFSDKFGALVTLALIGSAFLASGVYLGAVVFQFLKRTPFRLLLVFETLLLPIAVIGVLYGIGWYWKSLEPQMIYSYNKNLRVAEFVNPFLSYRMVDCSDMTEQYDVIFVPAHFDIETDVIAYAPRRKKNIKATFGPDWYKDATGSQWDRTLFNCVERNQAPN